MPRSAVVAAAPDAGDRGEQNEGVEPVAVEEGVEVRGAERAWPRAPSANSPRSVSASGTRKPTRRCAPTERIGGPSAALPRPATPARPGRSRRRRRWSTRAPNSTSSARSSSAPGACGPRRLVRTRCSVPLRGQPARGVRAEAAGAAGDRAVPRVRQDVRPAPRPSVYGPAGGRARRAPRIASWSSRRGLGQDAGKQGRGALVKALGKVDEPTPQLRVLQSDHPPQPPDRGLERVAARVLAGPRPRDRARWSANQSGDSTAVSTSACSRVTERPARRQIPAGRGAAARRTRAGRGCRAADRRAHKRATGRPASAGPSRNRPRTAGSVGTGVARRLRTAPIRSSIRWLSGVMTSQVPWSVGRGGSAGAARRSGSASSPVWSAAAGGAATTRAPATTSRSASRSTNPSVPGQRVQVLAARPPPRTLIHRIRYRRRPPDDRASNQYRCRWNA